MIAGGKLRGRAASRQVKLKPFNLERAGPLVGSDTLEKARIGQKW